MVKNVFSNLSRGFFYTIGRVIAFLLIGFIIGLIVVKLDKSNPPNTFGGGLLRNNILISEK